MLGLPSAPGKTLHSLVSCLAELTVVAPCGTTMEFKTLLSQSSLILEPQDTGKFSCVPFSGEKSCQQNMPFAKEGMSLGRKT